MNSAAVSGSTTDLDVVRSLVAPSDAESLREKLGIGLISCAEDGDADFEQQGASGSCHVLFF